MCSLTVLNVCDLQQSMIHLQKVTTFTRGPYFFLVMFFPLYTVYATIIQKRCPFYSTAFIFTTLVTLNFEDLVE